MGDNLIEVCNNLKENMENNNVDINKDSQIISEIVSEIQNKCLKSEFGKAVNSALDVGIRNIFPDLLEDQIINLKDNIYNYGVKDGLSQTIDDAINFGKATIGILTNDFESISQAQSAMASGGTIDKISELLDTGIDGLKNKGTISSSTAKTLKKEKNAIIKNIEKNIENSFSNQIDDMAKLEKYISTWKENFDKQDFSSMEKEFNKMKKVMNSLMPIEKTLVEYRTIENLQELMKKNGKNFNLSDEEIELANKLIN